MALCVPLWNVVCGSGPSVLSVFSTNIHTICDTSDCIFIRIDRASELIKAVLLGSTCVWTWSLSQSRVHSQLVRLVVLPLDQWISSSSSILCKFGDGGPSSSADPVIV